MTLNLSKQRVRRLISRPRWKPASNTGPYQADFEKGAEYIQRFLKRAWRDVPAPTRASIGVIIMPWVGTAVPWYSLALAVGLAQRGRAVTLVWDDTVFPAPSEFLTRQNKIIARVLEETRHVFPVLRLSAQTAAPPQSTDAPVIQHLTALNYQWSLRGGEPTPQSEGRQSEIAASLTHTLGLIRGLAARARFEYLLVPGGIYGASSLFDWVGRDNQLRVATYDTGVGWVTICPNGVAAQHFDIPRAFDALEQESAATQAWARAQAEQELARRRAGRDAARYQRVASGGAASDTAEILIPLNVEWDASALGRHTIFADGLDWLTATIAFILEQSAKSVAVRQHPAEQDEPGVIRADLEGKLRARFGDTLRLQFIRADAAVNTYDFLDAAELVLPFVSTVGMEAAAMEKIVLLAGSPYYGDLGFVHTPQTRAEYFALLARGLARELPLLPDQRQRALLCYYLSTLGNCVWTEFTPQPDDYWKWCSRATREVLNEAAVQDVLLAIDENQPLALVRHWRKYNERAAHASAPTPA